jgi:DNA-binding NtrC family response regulator
MSKKTPNVLVVEDSKSELSRYLGYLRDLGHQAFGVSTLEDALRASRSRRFDLMLTDIHLSAGETRQEGLELIEIVREEQPNLTIMAMSLDPRQDIAERARALGAFMFLRKPIGSADELAIQIQRALEVSALHQAQHKSVAPAMRSLLERYPEGIVMNSYLRRAVRGAVENDDICTVIMGETGTGKEEIAKLIHRYRAEQKPLPFVALNCANLQGDLMLSMLFGHKKGAFTGATETTLGAVGHANGGILFLDEFHRLTLQTQERLLRVLQDGSYQKVGEATESKSHFQLIAATSLDLEQAALDGIILMDLRMRLYGIEIKIPPLRERFSELADFIDFFFAKLDKPFTLTVAEREELIRVCKQYYWQGNIRQLFGVLQVLVMNAALDNEAISASKLPIYRSMLSPSRSTDLLGVAVSGSMQGAVDALVKFDQSPSDLDDLMNQVEKAAIESASSKFKSIKDLCVALNQPRSTLDAKRRKFGLA